LDENNRKWAGERGMEMSGDEKQTEGHLAVRIG